MSYQEYPSHPAYMAGVRRGYLDREEARLAREWDAPKLFFSHAGSIREDLYSLGLVIDQCPMELVTDPVKLRTLEDYANGYQQGKKGNIASCS